MKKLLYILYIDPEIDPDYAWQLLEEVELQPYSLSTSEGETPWALVESKQPLAIKEVQQHCSFVQNLSVYDSVSGVDWEQQWEQHAPGWKDGYQWFTIGGHELRLQPGPGFGDLSHPTTQLCLQLLEQQKIHEKLVVDIGCGSGILSLAACALGAQVIGIDIDDDALQHARSNASLNSLQVEFFLPEELTIAAGNKASIAVMNMIHSEQRQARQSMPKHAQKLITSGILTQERDEYIQEMESLGWKLLQEIEKDGWLGFVLTSTLSASH